MLRDGSDTDDSFSDDEDAGGGEEKEEPTYIPLPSDTPTISTGADPAKSLEQGGEDGAEGKPEDKGDPEMAPVYLKRLLPVFADLFHSSLAPILR